MMRLPAILLCFLMGLSLASASPVAIPPEQVLVLHNSDEPESTKLANYYARVRKIPSGNIVGLPLTTEESLSRADYDRTLRDPLMKVFDDKGWWTRAKNAAGTLQPATTKIRVIVCMRGVPYKIERIGAEKLQIYPASATADEASVDSELCLLGTEGYSLKGPLPNPYYKRNESILKSNTLPFLIGRIDGPTYALCTKLIDDAREAEKTGLWGTCYLDLALKGGGYDIGDAWIRSIANDNAKRGIPTVIESTKDTYVTNYPMTEAAVYFGWYAHHRNGPLLNPEFRFRRGAVAVHLHSFSANELRKTNKRWCGAILAKGAAATLGNVYEPFLQTTHNFDIFYRRLLEGYSLVEAAYMSVPAHSWQAVVLGDPLYRPFPATDEPDVEDNIAKDYKALRTAYMRWGDEPETLVTKVRSAAARMNSGRLYEALGLRALREKEPQLAAAFFNSASRVYLRDSDKLRQTLHLVSLDRQAGRKPEAIKRLRKAKIDFADIPEAKAITALLNILDPPAPPPVKVPPK